MAFRGFLKQSTAETVKLGPFVDESDGKTPETGLTISQADVRLAKNGGDMAQKNESTPLSHDEIGEYDCLLNATDTGTLGILRISVNESGALPVRCDFAVVPANVYDSLFGSDKLEVDVAQWLGTAAATPTVAGVPEVDLTHWRGLAVPATNEDGYPLVDIAYVEGETLRSAAVYTGELEVAANATYWQLPDDASNIDGFYTGKYMVVDTGLAIDLGFEIGDYDGPDRQAYPRVAFPAGVAFPGVGDQVSIVHHATSPQAEFTTTSDTLATLGTQLTQALADTNELQTDWANGGRLDTLLDTAASGGGGGLDADELRSALGFATNNFDTQIAGLNTKLDTIEGQTDDIGVAGAGLTDIPWNSAWDAQVESEVTDALNTYDPPTNTEFEARSLPAADYVIVSDLGSISASLGDNAIDADTLASDLDLYTGKIELVDDDNGTTDRWVVMFRKNGVWLSSGITSPTITITNLGNAGVLVSAAALTHVGSTIFWRYDATGSERIASGTAYGVTVTATIDGASRTIGDVKGRDTSV